MGKGSKRRPENTKKIEEKYDKIFGDKKPERGSFIFDEDKQRLVPEDEYVPKQQHEQKSPYIFLMGRGWPSKEHYIQNKQRKLLEKNPWATTLSDKAEKIKERTEKAKESNAEKVKKIKGNSL